MPRNPGLGRLGRLGRIYKYPHTRGRVGTGTGTHMGHFLYLRPYRPYRPTSASQPLLASDLRVPLPTGPLRGRRAPAYGGMHTNV